MQALVSKITKDYPNQKIIVYDTTMDYASDSAGLFKNTYWMEYKQNEGSFLAGGLAAEMTSCTNRPISFYQSLFHAETG